MSLGKCNDCQKVVGRLVRGLCTECFDAHEESFREVRRYFSSHAGTSVARVSEETGIPVTRINGWIAEGRLTRSLGVSAADVSSTNAERDVRLEKIRRALADQRVADAAKNSEVPTVQRGMLGRK